MEVPMSVDGEEVEDGQLVEEGENEQPTTPKREPKKIEEEDVIKLHEERWPNVNGVYDAQGEWHYWDDLTYSYSYENSELIILPYTVCLINLLGQQYVTESSN